MPALSSGLLVKLTLTDSSLSKRNSFNFPPCACGQPRLICLLVLLVSLSRKDASCGSPFLLLPWAFLLTPCSLLRSTQALRLGCPPRGKRDDHLSFEDLKAAAFRASLVSCRAALVGDGWAAAGGGSSPWWPSVEVRAVAGIRAGCALVQLHSASVRERRFYVKQLQRTSPRRCSVLQSWVSQRCPFFCKRVTWR